MRMSGSPDAIVVGAGIVGAACAFFLSAEGLKVAVLESSFAGGGVTAAGMGHLVVMDDSEAQFALTSYSLKLWHELLPQLPAPGEFEKRGTIWVAEDDAQMTAAARKRDAYLSHGVAAGILSSSDLARQEPHLRQGLAGGLLVPGDAILYPPAGARALLELAKTQGVDLREDFQVTAIAAGSVSSATDVLHAGVIVNAAGPRAAQLTPGLPLIPRKGHLVITDRFPGFCRHQLVELGYLSSAHTLTKESVAFNVQPRATEQLLIGSSRELAGWNMAVNPAIVSKMVARAIEFMPGLASLSGIRIWTGLRPATPDKLPLIGRWTATPGLWIGAGHEGLGITTSTGTGKLLADMITGRATAIDPSPFAPDRPMPELAS